MLFRSFSLFATFHLVCVCVCFFSLGFVHFNKHTDSNCLYFLSDNCLSFPRFFSLYLFSTLPLNTWLLCVYVVKRSFGKKTDNVSFKNNSMVFASDIFTHSLTCLCFRLSCSFPLFPHLIAVIWCFRYSFSSVCVHSTLGLLLIISVTL